jgi:MFS family permease
MAAHRFAFGVLTIALLVLAREYLTDDLDAAVGVLVLAGAAGGSGALLAAVVTPPTTRRLGIDGWLVGCLAAAGAAAAVAVGGITVALVVGLAFVVALAGQGVKISVDTLVQTGVEDAFRGRAFAFYDVTYNAAFVGAAALAAVAVPADGWSPWLFAGLAAWYGSAAIGYARGSDAIRRAVGIRDGARDAGRQGSPGGDPGDPGGPTVPDRRAHGPGPGDPVSPPTPAAPPTT